MMLLLQHAKALTQCDYRNDLSADIDNAFNKCRRIRHAGERLVPDNLLYPLDLQPKSSLPTRKLTNCRDSSPFEGSQDSDTSLDFLRRDSMTLSTPRG
jgi:hypothetical protein